MHDRTANLLGAASLAVTDALLGATTAVATTGPSGTAALVVLSETPGLSTTELGRRVGLTQSAATRMVDSLAVRGLVERRPSVGKWVALELTAQGRKAAHDVLTTRQHRVAELLSSLDETERDALAALLEKVLTTAYGETPNSQWLCRLCDRHSCVEGGSARCPVGSAERERQANSPEGHDVRSEGSGSEGGESEGSLRA